MNVLPPHLDAMAPKERVDHERDVLKMLSADTLSLLLEDLGISQQELADRLGSSRANVSRMLSGSQNLKLSTIAAVCHALGVRLQPQLHAAERVGTPAEHDPPLPAWVEGSDAQRLTIQRQVQADLRHSDPEDDVDAAGWPSWSIRTVGGHEFIDD